MDEPRHWLVVEDGKPRVEHETCPTREGRYSNQENPYTEHACQVEDMVSEFGISYWLAYDLCGPIPDGRWEIHAWTSKTPTDYGTGVEYDAGLELVDDPRMKEAGRDR
jgi:hypothetical protein